MTKTLVIVESPAKAKTIKKYLGAGYEVLASKGHVKDLPKSQNAVDVANDFLERYEVIEGKEKVLDELKAAAKKVDAVMLATDPDREGEAIAFHIQQEILSPRLDITRVEFHEITKRGVENGVNSPRKLDENLYDAQRARRVLDRIVGYDVSALVWSKLAFGLSAGRVQSVALRLVVDREREIEAFVPEEYWNVGASLRPAGSSAFLARLATGDGDKLPVTNGEKAAAVRRDLEGAKFTVKKVVKKEQKRHAPAPYTTSKLQQDATNYLRFGAKRTMQVAQQLYEGVDLKRDGGPVGLITYMRTDSTRISVDAVAEARAVITKLYGAASLPEQPNVFKSKKSAQDAHEAIRPSSVEIHPDSVRKYLKDEQYKLYKLIWNRFVACQMAPAVYDRTTADIDAVPQEATPAHAVYGLRATGRVLKFAGWLAVTEEQREFAGEDEGADGAAAPDVAKAAPAAAAAAIAEENEDALLPDLNEGQVLGLNAPPGVLAEQKFTQPPPRYNEGSLVRELEKRGIGRPSTYAEIISKVQQRAYVERLQSGAFKPTMLGTYVVDGLVKSKLDFMDPNFTAQMEEELDEVGAGKLRREALLKRFYKRFREQLDVSKKLAPWKPANEKTDLRCEECGEGFMLKKWGKNGSFLSCERYPKCKATKDLAEDGTSAQATRETDFLCDKCDRPMVVKTGRFGEFLSCTGYPTCKNARPIPLGVACPQCGGDIMEVRSRKRGGRTFYGCSNYAAEQKCDFKLWAKPVPLPCPQCNATFLTLAGGKKPKLVCNDKACKYSRDLEEGEELPSPLTLTGVPIKLTPMPVRETEAEAAGDEAPASEKRPAKAAKATKPAKSASKPASKPAAARPKVAARKAAPPKSVKAARLEAGRAKLAAAKAEASPKRTRE